MYSQWSNEKIYCTSLYISLYVPVTMWTTVSRISEFFCVRYSDDAHDDPVWAIMAMIWILTLLLKVYISSVLHLNASSAWAFFLFFVSKRRFSKPVDRSTPSHRYPGRMPKRLGGGSGPLYTGYSAKKNNIHVMTTLTTWIP